MDTHNTPTSTHRPTGEKRNQFLGFPVDELEGFRRMAGFGYLVLAVASFVAMSFFITHNFIGTEKPLWDSVNGLNWSIGQLVYAFIGVSFAFGFNAFTWFFYQTEYNLKQRVFVFLVAVTFPMFTEIGQSMTRAEQTRHESATESETFKVMKGRVANAGTGGTDTGLASLLASATAEKAKAETALEQCGRYKSEKSRSQCQRKQEQAIAEAQGKIASYQQTGQEAKNTTSSQLAQDAHTLRELEGDTDFLQPIVKLLMGLGFPALLASFLIAFVIIGSIEVAMSYLGGLLREIKEAMRAMGAEVSSPKVKARLRESPIVSALHSTGEVIGAEMMKAQHGREQARQTLTGESKPRPTPEASPSRPAPAPADTVDLRESGGFKQSEEQREMVDKLARGEMPASPTHSMDRRTRTADTDTADGSEVRVNTRMNTEESGQSVRVNTRTETHTEEGEDTEEKPDYTDKLKQYEAVKNAPTGAVCGCPWCGASFTKKTYNHRFCMPSHKDDFWNALKPERLQAKEGRDRKRKARTA